MNWKLIQVLLTAYVGISTPINHLITSAATSKKWTETHKRWIMWPFWGVWTIAIGALAFASYKNLYQTPQKPAFECYLNGLRFGLTNHVVNGIQLVTPNEMTIPVTNNEAIIQIHISNITQIPAEQVRIFVNIPTSMDASASSGWTPAGSMVANGFSLQAENVKLLGHQYPLPFLMGKLPCPPLVVKYPDFSNKGMTIQILVQSRNADEVNIAGTLHFKEGLDQAYIGH